MRILFVGDVLGRSGRTAVTERLPLLKRDWKLDCVIVNGENAAGGFGITEAIYTELIDAGADVITGGNHSWDQREALVFIERAPRLIRPLNYPVGTPGRGMVLFETVGTHTHAPTSDHRVLAGGTAFITDVGMTGDYDSVIGMNKAEPLQRFVRRISSGKFEPALGPATFCAVAAEIDDATGLAARIAPVRLGGRLEEARPAFWD